jgi:hypothetical protein
MLNVLKSKRMAKESKFKTEFQKEKEAKDLAIYKEFKKLTATPGASTGEVTKHLMLKYRLHSPSTIWGIRKRVEARLSAKEEE